MTAFTPSSTISLAQVIRNPQVCLEHHKLVLGLEEFPNARPGQFVHLIEPYSDQVAQVRDWGDGRWPTLSAQWHPDALTFRRAFSVAAVRRRPGHCEIDVVYRVVGKSTAWMATLVPGATVNTLGPLGNHFSIDRRKRLALLVAGGVGLPPLIFLAHSLASSGVNTIAFCGAQSANLLPLELRPGAAFDTRGERAAAGAAEFDDVGAAVVISTDDGTLGFKGRVTDALACYFRAQSVEPTSSMMFSCGPVAMLRRVSELAAHWHMDCELCMERTMACGMGTCQSCVLPVHHGSAPGGFRYRLCCTDGPVFDAHDVVWR